MQRLVDVYGRFYLVLHPDKDYESYEETGGAETVLFQLKVLREKTKRSKFTGSLANDHMNLELFPGDRLILHAETNHFRFDHLAWNLSLMLNDRNTYSVDVFAFVPGKIASGHTLSQGKLYLMATPGLISFLRGNQTTDTTNTSTETLPKKTTPFPTGALPIRGEDGDTQYTPNWFYAD
jgi:hypothetical protein